MVFSWSDLPAIFTLAFIEIVLSADNAIVLALLTRALPPRLRSKALYAGLASAFLFRAAGLFGVAFLLEFAWIQLLGALYLIYLAIHHFTTRPRAESHSTGVATFWGTVLLIELYDLAFALDSLVAGVAFVDSPSKIWIVYVGGIIGLVAVRIASDLFSRIIDAFPRLEPAAYLMVGWVGLKLGLDAYAHGFNITLIPADYNIPFLWVGVLAALAYGLTQHKRAR